MIEEATAHIVVAGSYWLENHHGEELATEAKRRLGMQAPVVLTAGPSLAECRATMSDRIYLVSDNETLVPMEAAPYAREEVLQQLLERYPDLLAGEQISPEDPRRWLLIKREANICHKGGEVHRWRLDHLFLDQDGVPTLVETKIAANPELRRKVIGQMFDYASNLIEDWTVERMQREFEARCLESESQPDQVIDEFLSSDLHSAEQSVDRFWSETKVNLEAGRIRLLFIADRIPSSLLRIIEFLNRQMDPCEVLAVELRQYLHESEGRSVRTLVPRVHGQTAIARRQRQTSRTVNDPGIYILEPVAEIFEAEFGMRVRRRMHRRGWLRMDHPGGAEEAGWLIYQSRDSGTLNLYYDGGTFALEKPAQERVLSSLDKSAMPTGVALEHGYSEKSSRCWIRAVISGFCFDDDTRWGELRDTMKDAMKVLLRADW